MHAVPSDPATAARRLAELRTGGPVISLYLDLDPSRFATPPARASEIRSLLDEAAREVNRVNGHSHAQLAAMREDLGRLGRFLADPPTEAAGSLAVFASATDGLFETVVLPRPTGARVIVDSRPYVEPLAAQAQRLRWLVALVNRRDARFFTGTADRLSEQLTVKDDVPSAHGQGGRSQANYERSIEKDTDDHLRRVAAILMRSWRTASFQRVALGGPVELLPRLEAMLDGDVGPAVVAGRVDVDVESAGHDSVELGLKPLARIEASLHEEAILDRLRAGVGAGPRGHGVVGLVDTLEVLNQHRVECLVLEPGFEAAGGRCPQCGMLLTAEADHCPADGSPLERRDGPLMREALVEAALQQDAEVLVVSDPAGVAGLGGIGAVLRF